MTRVLVFGTFDILHPGHLSFLRQARRMGEWLIAAVARDCFVAAHKGRKPANSERRRMQAVRATGLVDEVRLGDRVPGSYGILGKTRPDVVCVGHDQQLLRADLKAWLRRNGMPLMVRTLRAYRPDRYKSSKLAGGSQQAKTRASPGSGPR